MQATGDASQDDPASAGDVGDPAALLNASASISCMQALRFEPCQISLAACRLCKLIHDVMRTASTITAADTPPQPPLAADKHAEKSSPMAFVLYQTARDCLELFMALVPIKFADVIAASPRMGAVFFNDCLYLGLPGFYLGFTSISPYLTPYHFTIPPTPAQLTMPSLSCTPTALPWPTSMLIWRTQPACSTSCRA